MDPPYSLPYDCCVREYSASWREASRTYRFPCPPISKACNGVTRPELYEKLRIHGNGRVPHVLTNERQATTTYLPRA